MVREPVTPHVQDKSPQGQPAGETWKPGDPVRVMPDLRLSLEGQYTMTGTVRKVEAATEMVSVETEKGLFVLYFPGAAKNLKAGETITLFLGYTKSPM